MSQISRDRAYFDALYDADPDPWRFQTSDYERRKYAETISLIQDRRYRSGLEVGCSIGVLSALIAPLCDRFLGIDISERPLAAAKSNCAAWPHAQFACMTVPQDWPPGQFDLIILSEVLYFLSERDIDALAARVDDDLEAGGRVLLVNWLGEKAAVQPGDAAANRYLSATPLNLVTRRHHAHLYRIDVLECDQLR